MNHANVPAGIVHVVANWTVASVAEMEVLAVTVADIGKQCWVRGVGSYTLASTSPMRWEAASPAIAGEFMTFAAVTAARPLAKRGLVLVYEDETNDGDCALYMYNPTGDKLYWIPMTEV